MVKFDTSFYFFAITSMFLFGLGGRFFFFFFVLGGRGLFAMCIYLDLTKFFSIFLLLLVHFLLFYLSIYLLFFFGQGWSGLYIWKFISLMSLTILIKLFFQLL